jgi:4-hydroxy-2-oxoglutarate aldolase
LDWLEEDLARMRETPLAGYLALGTNGEFKSLTESEKLQVVKVFVRLKGDKLLMVGTGCESTRQTIELTQRVADLGADCASVITPHYFASQMDDAALIGFYQHVADRSPIPVLPYNIPRLAAGVAISTQVASTLASHPNIWGMKDSGGVSLFAFLVALAAVQRQLPSPVSGEGQGVRASSEGRSSPTPFAVLAGSAEYFLPGLLLGACGGIISLANCFPELCCRLYSEAISGNLDVARQLHAQIHQATRAVSGKHGVAGVKAAMDLAGYRGGAPRQPLRPLTDQQREAMRSRLLELKLLR